MIIWLSPSEYIFKTQRESLLRQDQDFPLQNVRFYTYAKLMCSTLEQSHPLGRLWDIDVICPQNGLVGRQSLGESQRRCLLCDEPAHACARSRRHDTDLVVARVEQMIDAWFARD